MLDIFLRAAPWAIPVMVVSVVVASVVARSAARRWGGAALCWWAYLASTGAFVAATLTPVGGWWRWEWSSHPIRTLRPSLPDLDQLATVNEVSLNVLIGVPLGLSAVLLSRQLGRHWPLAVFVLPFVAELIQGMLPGLGRVGFLMEDVTANLLGMAIGGCIAPIVGSAAWWRRAPIS